jgi:hypothetical protein
MLISVEQVLVDQLSSQVDRGVELTRELSCPVG